MKLQFYTQLFDSNIIKLVLICIVADSVFGVLRAIKERKFNSNFGINGAIRKVGMILSVLILAFTDNLVNLNLIGFVPKVIREYFNLKQAGMLEFFSLLFICYEVVSILKNMTLCGLPVKKIWLTVSDFMKKYTSELIDYEDK